LTPSQNQVFIHWTVLTIP